MSSEASEGTWRRPIVHKSTKKSDVRRPLKISVYNSKEKIIIGVKSTRIKLMFAIK